MKERIKVKGSSFFSIPKEVNSADYVLEFEDFNKEVLQGYGLKRKSAFEVCLNKHKLVFVFYEATLLLDKKEQRFFKRQAERINDTYFNFGGA